MFRVASQSIKGPNLPMISRSAYSIQNGVQRSASVNPAGLVLKSVVFIFASVLIHQHGYNQGYEDGTKEGYRSGIRAFGD